MRHGSYVSDTHTPNNTHTDPLDGDDGYTQMMLWVLAAAVLMLVLIHMPSSPPTPPCRHAIAAQRAAALTAAALTAAPEGACRAPYDRLSVPQASCRLSSELGNVRIDCESLPPWTRKVQLATFRRAF
jgi:hypothetical protein